jgi:hypothetical protein
MLHVSAVTTSALAGIAAQHSEIMRELQGNDTTTVLQYDRTAE